jgi:hypothetical protein
MEKRPDEGKEMGAGPCEEAAGDGLGVAFHKETATTSRWLSIPQIRRRRKTNTIHPQTEETCPLSHPPKQAV